MQRFALLISTLLFAGPAIMQGQATGKAIQTPDRLVPSVNQTPEGTWLYELRRGGQPADQPPVLLLIQFKPDGSIAASAADGTQSGHHGIWLRVGDRRFLFTTFVFSFNEARTLATIIKVRGNIVLSDDGATARGTQEVVVMSREGGVMATIPGGTFAGTRLASEIPGDFQQFQTQP
jgi:hypothetical protein